MLNLFKRIKIRKELKKVHAKAEEASKARGRKEITKEEYFEIVDDCADEIVRLEKELEKLAA